MNWFPQVGAGAVAQFPLQRKRQWRAISNSLASGERIALPDSNGGKIDWILTYQELSEAEVAKLTGLFAASSGEVVPFGFVDPFANLLGWSEDLLKPDWEAGLLNRTGGVSDPVGTQRAWMLHNPGEAEQVLSQTLPIPGEYTTCFSAYVRSEGVGAIGILRDTARIDLPVAAQWKRIQISGTGTGGATQATFGLAIGTGNSIKVFGLQVEAQPWASPYRLSGAPTGILTETRFATGELAITQTDPGLSSCQVRLVSRV